MLAQHFADRRAQAIIAGENNDGAAAQRDQRYRLAHNRQKLQQDCPRAAVRATGDEDHLRSTVDDAVETASCAKTIFQVRFGDSVHVEGRYGAPRRCNIVLLI